ncbi:MAG: hypothetical protein ACYTGH_18285, partial [Planctomycetota bacterium]
APTWGCQGKLSRKQLKSDSKNTVLEIQYSDRNSKGMRPRADQRKTPIQLRLNRDLSQTPFVTLDAFNPGKRPISFSLAFETGSGYEWFETQPITLPAGKWKVGLRFDLNRKNSWKAKRTGWTYGTPVLNSNRTRNLTLLILNGTRKGVIYFDAIKFEKAQ